MNKTNVLAATEIMKRARGRVDMNQWQSTAKSGKVASNESELHGCGNTACFAGWVAVSPEFQESGGFVDIKGIPSLRCDNYLWIGEEAIASWLGIDLSLANKLVFGDQNLDSYSDFYDKWWDEVTADDVIKKLELILNGELTSEEV